MVEIIKKECSFLKGSFCVNPNPPSEAQIQTISIGSSGMDIVDPSGSRICLNRFKADDQKLCEEKQSQKGLVPTSPISNQ